MRVNETPEHKRKCELIQCFRRGWKHGATTRMDDPRFTKHTRAEIREAYQRGFDAGRDASSVAFMRECERLNYDPSMDILRSDPTKEPIPEGTQS